MSHLQLNLSKTELFVIPDSPSIEHDISIQLSSDSSLQQIWLSWLIWTYYTQRMRQDNMMKPHTYSISAYTALFSVYLYSNGFYYIFIQILFNSFQYLLIIVSVSWDLLSCCDLFRSVPVNFSRGGSIKEHLISLISNNDKDESPLIVIARDSKVLLSYVK